MILDFQAKRRSTIHSGDRKESSSQIQQTNRPSSVAYLITDPEALAIKKSVERAKKRNW
jgi:hypothetical protein